MKKDFLFQNSRGSSKKKDTSVTPGEIAVQVRPPRSNLKSLRVEAVSSEVIKTLIIQGHYLHSMPATTTACFAVYQERELVGAAVFTIGSRSGYLILSAAKPQDVATLARFYLKDALPKNSESRVLSIILRMLRNLKPWKFLLSFADPAYRHVGTIYQATGWLYLGMTGRNGYVGFGENLLFHPRSLYNHFKTNSLQYFREHGIPASRHYFPGKHRYGYFLDPSWRWRLRYVPQPYPRKEA